MTASELLMILPRKPKHRDRTRAVMFIRTRSTGAASGLPLQMQVPGRLGDNGRTTEQVHSLV